MSKPLSKLAIVLVLLCSASAAQAAVTALNISGMPASTQAGTAATFTVTAVDGSGAVVPGYTGTVHLATNYTATVLPANYTFKAADAGVHTFSMTPKEAGTQVLTVNDTANGSIYGNAVTTCTPTTAAIYSISNLTSGASLNAGLPATFTVTAYDQYWNVATSYAGSAVITSSDPAAVRPPNPTFSNGVANNIPITFNTAGGQSVTATDTVLASMNDTAWATITAGANATITAAAKATTGATGLAASVASQSGVTYAWSITGGTITSATNTAAIVYSAGAVGTLKLTCVVTKTSTGAATTGTANVSVLAAPATPVITAASPVSAAATGRTASTVAHAGMTYKWTISGGTITSSTAGVTSGTTNTMTYTAGAAGTATITCVETNGAAASSAAGVASVTVTAAPVKPVITAATPVTTGTDGNTATVVAHAGMTYSWTIAGGTITDGAGTAAITYSAGAAGTLTLTCAEVNSGGTASAAGTKSISVIAAPTTPVITAAGPVQAGATGRTASVVAHAGMHYLWSITNGTITSAGGTAGVTSGTTNTITYTAGTVGTISLTAVELNALNVQSAAAAASVTVAAAVPATPVITSASPITSGATGTATVVAHASMTYGWTISNGTITSAGGTSGVTNGAINSITFTAGAAGSLVLTAVEINSTGTSSAAGTKTVAVSAAPNTPLISAPTQVTAGTTGLTASVSATSGMTYAWTISGGSFTSTAAGVTSGGTNTVTFTAGGAGTLTLSCTESNNAGASSVPGGASVAVIPVNTTPQQPIVTAPANVSAGATGLTATTAAHTGMVYIWSVTGGTITGSAAGVTSGGVNTVTFAAGAAGTLTVSCSESNGADLTSAPGTANVNVVAAPATPAITAPAGQVAQGATGLVASVTANPGMTYRWTISNGSITSPGGTAGVSSGGTNSITFTAGSSGVTALTCAEVNTLGASSAPGSASVAISGSTGGQGVLFFVAHQDDDLLFQNPDLELAIQSGKPTRMVFFTAAGSPDTASWQGREHGVYTPYMMMANATYDIYADAATYWTCAPKTFAGKSVRVCTLTQNPKVSVVFLRLLDGSLPQLWDTTSAEPFYVTPKATLTAVDNTATYTKAELVATTAAIINDFAPGMIGTLDSTFAYGDDHQDHITSSLLATEAEHQYFAPHQLRQFRGYNMYGNYFNIPVPEIFNLSNAEYVEKRRIMVGYGGDFPAGDPYEHWCRQRYAIGTSPGGTGHLVEPGGKCLTVTGGVAALATCTDTDAARWTITTDAQIIGLGGKCLTMAANGTTESVADCTGADSQRFRYFTNGQIRGINQNCLGIAANGTTVQGQLCTADSSVNLWTVPVTQSWTLQMSAPATWSQPGQFSDADVPAVASSYDSFHLADVNGDGFADACIRLPAGLYCALNNGAGGFGSYSLYSSELSDANGWGADAYGATLQFADLNGDGKADVCARSTTGLVCALAAADGLSFGNLTSWSAGNDFSDSAGFAVNASNWGSIRLADVNGDGRPDACGRTAAGIVCALNTGGGTFAAATTWSTDFSDALGFQPDKYGRTLQLGDINGDGKADLCVRNAAGVRCATANAAGTGFINARSWALRADFADLDGWGGQAGDYLSISLADVNGDGLADLCGRTVSGVVCAHSNGGGFDRYQPVQPREFTDARGWLPVQYGSTIQFGDLNRDGKADVCGKSAAGLVCATSP